MKNSLETRLGFFFALVIIAAFILLEMIGAGALLTRGTELQARFGAVRDLKVGDPVKLAGVPVGRVRKISIQQGKVEVKMDVSPEAGVRTDSIATIQFAGLMGQNFVSLTFGSEKAPLAEKGATLESREQPDLSQIMSKLESVADGVQNMTKSFSGDEISKLFGPFTDFLKQNQPKIAAILGNVQNITGSISEGQGTVGKLIHDATLYQTALTTVSNLNQTVSDVKPLADDARATVAEARTIMGGISRGEGSAGKLVKDERLYSNLADASSNLKDILQKINQGKGSVGGLVNDDTLLKNVKLTLQKVDKATEGLEDTGPLTIVGAVAGKLF
jgi:phospholipid/cholesterol/gamma-HCH transport system substrate-binding protein